MLFATGYQAGGKRRPLLRKHQSRLNRLHGNRNRNRKTARSGRGYLPRLLRPSPPDGRRPSGELLGGNQPPSSGLAKAPSRIGETIWRERIEREREEEELSLPDRP